MMKNNSMLFLMLALGSSGGGSLDLNTILLASDMMPEMMRMILAINAAKKRDDEANDLASQVRVAIQGAVVDTNTTTPRVKFKKTVVEANSELKGLLDRLSVTDYADIVDSER